MRQVANITYALAGSQAACQFDSNLFAHAVGNHIGRRVAQQALLEAVAPVVVMTHAAQRGLDTTQHYGYIGIKLLEDFGIYDGGVLGTHIVATVGAVGIL